MAEPRPSPSPCPELTQLLLRVAALEGEVVHQHTTLAAVRDSQEVLRQMLADLHVEREATHARPFALLGRLAAGLAHDLCNPLASILLHVELLEEEWRLPSAQGWAQMAESLGDIKTQLMRLDDLVQDYLSLLQVERLELTWHKLGAVVQAWTEEWQMAAQARRVRLEVEGLEHLGSVALHLGTLRRAMRNVMLNALEAMSPGGAVTLAGQNQATQVQLQVRDRGKGIAAEQLPRIFDPLYTTKPGGTGLGLYIVQRIIAAHRGQVGVESVEGEGTTVTITLPRNDAEARGQGKPPCFSP